MRAILLLIGSQGYFIEILTLNMFNKLCLRNGKLYAL